MAPDTRRHRECVSLDMNGVQGDDTQQKQYQQDGQYPSHDVPVHSFSSQQCFFFQPSAWPSLLPGPAQGVGCGVGTGVAASVRATVGAGVGTGVGAIAIGTAGASGVDDISGCPLSGLFASRGSGVRVGEGDMVIISRMT